MSKLTKAKQIIGKTIVYKDKQVKVIDLLLLQENQFVIYKDGQFIIKDLDPGDVKNNNFKIDEICIGFSFKKGIYWICEAPHFNYRYDLIKVPARNRKLKLNH